MSEKPKNERGELFSRAAGNSDYEEWLLYAAVVAHNETTGETIPNIPEGGLRIAMQVNGIEVSPRHLLAAIRRHFDNLGVERDKVIRKAAAKLIKGRVRKLNATFERVEELVRDDLVKLFPELSEEIYENDHD